MTALALFLSTFMLVCALGAQSLFVNNGRYGAAALNSFFIGSGNLILFKLEISAFILGGPCGICTAMFILRHLHRR